MKTTGAPSTKPPAVIGRFRASLTGAWAPPVRMPVVACGDCGEFCADAWGTPEAKHGTNKKSKIQQDGFACRRARSIGPVQRRHDSRLREKNGSKDPSLQLGVLPIYLVPGGFAGAGCCSSAHFSSSAVAL